MRSSGLFSKCIPGLLAGLLVLGSVSVAFSGLRTLGDQDLAVITGQSGVSIYEDLYTKVTIDSLQIYDSGGVNSLEFRNLTIDKDGTGAPFQIYTPVYIGADPNQLVSIDAGLNQIVAIPIEFDIGTNDAGRTIVRLIDSSHMAPRTYTVDRFFFCDQELGSNENTLTPWTIQLAALQHMQPDILHYGAHADGSIGIDFDYSTQLQAASFQYNYNNAGGALSFTNIHLANAADLTGDNPADPSTWHFTGNNYFQIGNIHNSYNSAFPPATLDVGTNSTDPDDTSLFLNLPMKGTLRVGKVIFGKNGTDINDPTTYNSNFLPGADLNFGPIAIDGINAHHLYVKISTK